MLQPGAPTRRSLIGILVLLGLFEAYSACVGNDRLDEQLGAARFALDCAPCLETACRYAGTCNTETGQCTLGAPKPNTTPCNDGNACTQADFCDNGSCSGFNPVVCTALDQCHDVGTCNPANGTCSNPNKMDGTGCNDGDACSQTDQCLSGVCNGTNPKLCPTPDQCHNAVSCDPATGMCPPLPAKTDGTGCNDGNGCTQTDTCQGGVCVGANPKSCSAGDQCNTGTTCDPATGSCTGGAPKANGTACTDGNNCTTGDACQGGVCVGTAVTCTTSNPCKTAACNPSTGTCDYPNKPDNTSCNDGKQCTTGDKCTAGVCAGVVSCPASDQCHDAGACDASNNCTNPVKADGTMCDYEKWVNPSAASNKCTTPNDTCKAGACTADPNPVVCPQLDCNTVACQPSTGNCVYTPVTAGTGCGVTGCYTSGTCSTVSGRGQCSGTPKDCSGSASVCKTGICDASNGQCSGLNLDNGTSCAASDLCLIAPACLNGVCTGDPKVCEPSSACRVAMCNPTTGGCDETVAPVGTACAGKDECNPTGECDATGNCVVRPLPDGTPCSAADCPTAGLCVNTTCNCKMSSGEMMPPDKGDTNTTTTQERGCAIAAGRSTGGMGVLMLGLLYLVGWRRRTPQAARARRSRR